MFSLSQVIFVAFAFTRLVAGSTSPIIAQYWPAYSSARQSPAQITSWDSTNIMLYFVTVTTATGMELPDGQSTEDITSFVSQARANGVTPIFTLGGWTGSRYFSALAADPAKRKKLAQDLLAFNDKWGFGGVDVDWEYPNGAGMGCNSPTPNDTANFLLLLQQIRAAFGKQLVTAAVSMTGFNGPDGEPVKDVSAFAEVLDYLMIMAYDVSGASWSETTGPLAPLRSCSSGVGVESSIDVWTGAGFPASQLLLGIPAYAISFTASSSQLTNTTTLQGGYSSQLYNTKTSKTPQGDPEVDVGAEAGIDACGNASGAGGYSGQWGMKELIAQGLLSADEQTGGEGFVRYWDECTATPFLFNPTSKTLVSYDDSQSVKMKAEYAISRGLGGAMIFDTLGFTNKVYGAVREGLGLPVAAASSTPVASSTSVIRTALPQTVQATSSTTSTSSTASAHHLTSTATAESSTAVESTRSSVPASSSPPSSSAAPHSAAPHSAAEVAKLHLPTAGRPQYITSASSSPSAVAETKPISQAYILCNSTTTWSICASTSECTPMGSVAAGTTCQNGELVWGGSLRRRERRAIRGVHGYGEFRHPRSGISRR